MLIFEIEYQKLNVRQRAAVDTIDGPVLVIAGPGTGKTQLLSMRVANILRLTDTVASNILCLTFTEAAAINMRVRLHKLIGSAAAQVKIYTFHGFGSEIIQHYPEYFEFSPLLKPIDELGAYEILHALFDHLPHNNPLARRVGKDFLHLRSAQTTISWLKQAGFTPDSLLQELLHLDVFVSFLSPLVESVFASSPSTKALSSYLKLLKQLQAFQKGKHIIANLCATELAAAISVTDPAGRNAKAITRWRNRWLTQTKFKIWQPVDAKRHHYMQAIVDLYRAYENQLNTQGAYSYDDMILRTNQALETNEELRLTLQEQYQYILVDEYQDTNGAQEKLLRLLADNPVHEGRPNLMVVGDDDQAIYRFQGAYASIMLDFAKQWREPVRIVMTDNYRSGKALLKLARHVILQAEERLERHWPELNKELVAATVTKPVIKRVQALTEIEQYVYIASEIKRLISTGSSYNDIAVLAPKHSYLQALVPYLMRLNIPLQYERREHILNQPRIVELITFARLLRALGQGEWETVNCLLPQLLAADYWNLPPLTITQLSIEAYRSGTFWLEILLQHDSEHLQRLGRALAILGEHITDQPFELSLDQMLGTRAIELDNEKPYYVPFRKHYFSNEQLQENPVSYLKLLSQLTTLREQFKEYRPHTMLKIADFIDFIEAYERSNLTLLDTSPYSSAPESVSLTTAFKAKGKEWDTVIILSCLNDVWGTKTRSRSNSFGLPISLEWIKPVRDHADDRLRLFYVALTRAKRQLYLTSFSQTLKGKETDNLAWLLEDNSAVPAPTSLKNLKPSELIIAQETFLHGDYIDAGGNLQSLLQPEIERYYLSATHLSSFLNIIRGGPRQFLNKHLLHFPEAVHPNALYGNAVHRTLQFVHNFVTNHRKLPSDTLIYKIFLETFQTYPLKTADRARLESQGKQELKNFLVVHGPDFTANDKSEYSFKSEGVQIGSAKITGAVDVLRPSPDQQLLVIDYKTGAPLESWRPAGTEYQRIKAHFYKQQLVFYKLLVEGSATFGKKYQVSTGRLEFISPDEENELLSLNYTITSDDVTHLRTLIQAVWSHIMELDFPDTSEYSNDLKGILAFEQSLLQNNS